MVRLGFSLFSLVRFGLSFSFFRTRLTFDVRTSGIQAQVFRKIK